MIRALARPPPVAIESENGPELTLQLDRPACSRRVGEDDVLGHLLLGEQPIAPFSSRLRALYTPLFTPDCPNGITWELSRFSLFKR